MVMLISSTTRAIAQQEPELERVCRTSKTWRKLLERRFRILRIKPNLNLLFYAKGITYGLSLFHFMAAKQVSIFCCNALDGGTKGSLTCSSHTPSVFSKYFTPTGFPSSYIGPLMSSSLYSSTWALP